MDWRCAFVESPGPRLIASSTPERDLWTHVDISEPIPVHCSLPAYVFQTCLNARGVLLFPNWF